MEIVVESLAAGGRGVARLGGLVWFVPGALPGDRILAEAVARRPRYVVGRVIERLAPSPDRREPPCELQERCGGCPWMALGEAAQRDWKRRLVQDALHRIAGSRVEVEPVRPSPRALGYRNKVELTLGRDASGQPAIGFHALDPGSSGLVDVNRCPVQSEAADAVLGSAREYLLARPAGWMGAQEPFRLVLRTSRLSGRVLVALREAARPFPEAQALAEHLARAHAGRLAGVVRIRGLAGRRGGARVVPLVGQPWIEERIGATRFRLPAATFLQVNSEAAELLVGLVREVAGVEDREAALDLYGGVGAFGIDLARLGARVTVCEADLEAVRCGIQAARTAGSRVVRFVHGDVAAFLRDAPPAELVVANPPRTGLGPRVAERIAALRPRRVVLVSCDPPTLARDVRRLAGAGLGLERVVPIDVFPQTAHVECVVSLAPS